MSRRSLAKRLGIEEGTQLPRSIIEFYYKNEQLGDPMCRKSTSPRSAGRRRGIDDIMALAIRVNDFLCGLFLGVGIRLVDFKMECGRLWENDLMRIVVADRFPRTRAGCGTSSRTTSSTRTASAATSAVCSKPIRMWRRRLGIMSENERWEAPDRCW
jgi:phosphoribosylaminoimidazole-succinocarboxamide synthase